MNQREIVDLYKALSTNDFQQIQGPGNQTGGAALIPESLEQSLKVLTYDETNLKLWRDIPKVKAFSTVEEYNTITDYGEDLSGFQREGIAGVDTTASIERNFELIKCLNTTRSITDLQTLVTNVTEPEALETQNGMRYILGQAERALFYGDSTLSADGKEGIEWNGIMKQAEANNTIDLKGEYLTDKVLNNSAETVLNNYGQATKVYMPINVSRVFSEQYYPNQRALMNVEAGSVVAGTTVTQFNSVGGTMDVVPNVFMRRGITPLDPKQAAAGQNPPSAPTVKAEAYAEGEGDAIEKGTYRYAVVAYNENGRSVAVEAAPLALTEGQAKGIKLTIKNSDAQLFAPEYFVIYRTEKDQTTYYEIARVGAKTSQKGGETEFIDKNETLPNTAMAVVGDFREQNIVFKQLAPMFKLPYAMVGPVRRFGVFLYGTPIVYAPKRFVVIKNIKVK